VRGLVAGAVYAPNGSVAAPDEDAFTMAATAVELLGAAHADRAAASRPVAVGDVTEATLEDLARFLGTPSANESPSGSAPPTLAAALRAARDASPESGGTLIVSVELPSRSSPGTARGSAGDRATALWIDEGAGSGLEASPRDAASIEPMLSAAETARPGAPGAAAADRDPSGPGLAPDRPVAQGAYVPWPRYVEGIPAHWRLAADRCSACGAISFPPRGRCRACGEISGLTKVRLDPDSGRVAASTTIGPGGQPTEFDEQVAARGPYSVVLLEFDGGARATMQVAPGSPSRPRIGQRLPSRLRRLYPMEGRWRYGRKVVPVDGTSRSAPGPA
jgi:hydroxymethylglutaryl-CoA synthase